MNSHRCKFLESKNNKKKIIIVFTKYILTCNLVTFKTVKVAKMYILIKKKKSQKE